MNLIKTIVLTTLLLTAANLFASGGDDAGNGGFAYKQSIKILKMATEELDPKIANSDLKDLIDHPEWRTLLQKVLKYDNLRKLYLLNQYRDGKKLAMNYDVSPPRITILKPYYQAFAGKTDTELEDASMEVQKRLLHEAAHIWGYKEEAAEKFSIAFLAESDSGSKRPTNAIDIKTDFCSCINGKSDLINNCDSFCAAKPISNQPVLYVNTIIGAEIALNPKLGNLYNWCSVQLRNDYTTPQCVLNADDGTNTTNIPVNLNPGSNSFSANINSLSKNRSWILKLVEVKTGSLAKSKEFQIYRTTQPDSTIPSGSLKITPISQYTCLTYGGKIDSVGNVQRTSYARLFFNFPASKTPPPMPAAGGVGKALTVCHDEQRYPTDDSALYPRFELIPDNYIMWDLSDPRFVSRPQDGGKILINKILEDRLADEYGINTTLNLFPMINYPNRPGTSTAPLGYMMVPFANAITGKSFCPTQSDFSGSQPVMNLLGEYMDNTEALYIAEKEAELLQDSTGTRTVYGTMLISESKLLNNAFYIENGLKLLADKNAFHTKTIYYYWPISKTMDPLTPGNRKLFTIRTVDELNGSTPVGIPSARTTDKRIGCVPQGVF